MLQKMKKLTVLITIINGVFKAGLWAWEKFGGGVEISDNEVSQTVKQTIEKGLEDVESVVEK